MAPIFADTVSEIDVYRQDTAVVFVPGRLSRKLSHIKAVLKRPAGGCAPVLVLA